MKYKLLKILSPLLLFCFCFAQCKKSAIAKTELEKLPPATQTGANTFGCLLNGQAWIPNDNYGQPTFKLDADPTYGNGKFAVSATKYDGTGNGIFFAFSFGSISCKQTGVYSFNQPDVGFSIFDSKLQCLYDNNSSGVYRSGSFTITRYDLNNRIFSGTFEFTLYYNGCNDTLHFTNGRFDKKL